MIETHVVNALLTPEHRSESFFTFLSFINGLVAPSFTFCAGFALAITLGKKWDEYTQTRFSYWRYIARLLFILAVGYTLHIPVFSLQGMLNTSDPKLWQSFFQADILHVISVTLLVTVILVVIIRNRTVFDYGIAGLALAIIFMAPIIRELDYSQYSIWLRPYLSRKYSSQFPLFPWSAFLLCGVIAGAWILRHPASSTLARNRFGLFALLTIAISLLVEILPFTIYPNSDFWNASPQFFFVRLGIVCLILTLCWYIEFRQQGFFRKAIALFGTESLLVYVVHLIIVYGHTFEWSFIRLFGKTLNYMECFGLSLVLIAAMYGLALGWGKLKRWNPKYAAGIQYAVIAGIIIRFLAG